MSDLIPVECFAAGTYRDMRGRPVTFDERDLDEIVGNFAKLSDVLHPPVKLGHGEQQLLAQGAGQPSLGYVAALERRGRKLVAQLSDVPAVLVELMRKKRYRKVSSEFHLAFQHSDYEKNLNRGVSGKVLEGLSLLGADLPQVSNLQELGALLAGGVQEPLTLEAATAPEGEEHLVAGIDVPLFDDATLDALAVRLAARLSPAQSTATPNPPEDSMADEQNTDDLKAQLAEQKATIDRLVAAEQSRATADQEATAERVRLAQEAKDATTRLAAAETQLLAAREREREHTARSFAASYCREDNLRIQGAQVPLVVAMHLALSRVDGPVLAAADAVRLECAKAGEAEDMTGVALLTAFLDSAPDHAALLSRIPRDETDAGDDFHAKLAKVAKEFSLDLDVPAERMKALDKLGRLDPDTTGARFARGH